ncbi:acyl dehydratase [Denitratisoma sp. DHT3]|uniref:MaoC family dehydratase n=1 Tax=Denitratisoma sp. DHT3 TaxID=1981880 RepID=UPI00119890C6|nr:MaoC family dehydratase [Denitratisoma sp. DHT3]QDX80167.1 acyl dehydratase [Denitratisoma sp. DHT3]
MSWTETRRFDQVAVGEDLPPLDIPISVRQIVSCAIATRDYQNVHHDLEATRALGSPNIFMNILTTGGLVERYIGEWAGPEALFRKVAIRLGAPNYPGDTMTMSAKVTAKGEAERTVELDVTGRNAIGNHLMATVVVALPC